MAKKYKVLPDWFKKTDELGYLISTWCKKQNEKEAFCNICSKSIYCESKGFAAITQHVRRNVHKDNASVKLNSTQLLLKSNTQSNDDVTSNKHPELELICNREAITKAEIIWALKSVECNMAASASDDLKEVFSAMFPDSIAQNFHLGRTKLSYFITEALGPYFRKALLNDIKNSYFTLLFDETTNNAGKKELQFQIMYWSEEAKEIVCRHLQTVFLGHATAEDIVREIQNVLNSAGLSLNKLLMLGSDGPYINKKVWRLVNSKVFEEREYGLIDIGSCCIHVVHNAFLKGIEEFGDSASELVIDIYKFFKKFPCRWEDFVKIQVRKGVPKLRFLKHVSNRWLTLGPAAERLLQQWLVVTEYFFVFLPEERKSLTQTEKYKRIIRGMRIIDIKVELNFLVECSNLYASFLEQFQKSEPLIHALDAELRIILQKISGRICKPDVNIEGNIAIEHLRKTTSIDCEENTKKEISKLKQSDQLDVCRKIQRHYMSSYNYIMSKNIIQSDSLLSDLRCLSIKNLSHRNSINSIGRIARNFSFIGIKDIDVKDEWRLFQVDNEIVTSEATRIDYFWKNVIYQTTCLGQLKYPSLSKLIKVCLSLSHGNSEVERGFSVSRRILSEDKSAMSERVLNDRLIIRDAIKNYSTVALIPIDKELLKLAYGARRSYEHYLEEQKKMKEEQLKIEKDNEEKLKQKKIQDEMLMNLKGSVEKLEVKAKLAKQERKETQESADILFKEANERLKVAIQKKKDIESIRIAQGMIEGSIKLREKERKHEQKENKLNMIVNKRKSNLIESFFCKKPKTK